ncbi:MAG: single-stranded-DNA-specific exonuclease RecJ [Intestinibacter sp.]|uniref:single-stranded-DNA-specific exonuclease RecJ n=1 Tax=Intestinibacter sp. TaxID=1965304 RepID=UPI002A7F5A53|nr:single-stranded-DNA-specific exonuclease RecJ [Intestinibacter sp.]MDY4575511.1 single-stranded-DNA-specific exonuclease RecJ [Intestinibacter sp.]
MLYKKKWTLKHFGKIKEDEMSKKICISPEISQILKNRDIITEKDAEIFMNPSLDYLRDPFLLKDMQKAVDRIKEAVDKKERIFIYGDYDVDGVSSTSILFLYFKSIGYDVKYYIPNRLEEGYGISIEALEKINQMGCDLLISVDCGITSYPEVEFAKSLGIDVIITDHHECQSDIPDAIAVINPKQPDCNYPFDSLCGCGVAFKLIQALTPPEEFKKAMYNYLEIVTLATICDMVPLKDENRIIVKNGLNMMKDGRNIGLQELIKVCGVDNTKIGSSHIGYSVGPRINASGRLGYSYLGVELFTTEDRKKAKDIALDLEEKNNERQLIESKMYSEAEAIINSDKSYENDKVLVIAKEGWQHGIIGIVASKLTEKYYKPTILLTIEEGMATGSARSIKGFSIFDTLVECKDLMTKFGGHEQAAGLSMDSKNIEELRQRVNKIADYNLTQEDMIENIKVEYELEEQQISLDLVEELHKLEPFGLSNPTPRFIMRDLVLANIGFVGAAKQHLKITLQKDFVYEAIGFNMAYLADEFTRGDKVDVLFQLGENNYNNNRKVQLLLKDVRIAHPKSAIKDFTSIKLFSKIVPEDVNNLYKINYNLENNRIKNENFGQNEISNNFNIEDVSNGDIFQYFEENTLVICNTLNGFFRAYSDLSLIDDEFDVDFGKITKNTHKIKLIFSPYLDKLDLNIYNNIILYDFLYNKEEYSYLLDNVKLNTNFVKYYDDKNKLYLNNIMENIIPNRNEFITIYKYCITNKHVELTLNKIKSTLGIMPLKLFVILSVFREFNLLNYQINETENTLIIDFTKSSISKFNLDESLILQNIEQLRNKYLESY